MKTVIRLKAGEVSLDLGPLEALEKTMEAANGMYTAVGILNGGHQRRKVRWHNNDLSNAEIGLIHEKGGGITWWGVEIPRRSFLLVPLIDHLNDKISGIGKAVWDLLINTPNGAKAAFKKIGWIAEEIIQTGFNTGGYGKWRPNSLITIRDKGSSEPLIDSSQLRKDISSEVRQGK